MSLTLPPDYFQTLATKYYSPPPPFCRELLPEAHYRVQERVELMLKPYSGRTTEKQASTQLKKHWSHVQYEVQTPMGFADVITNERLVELKSFGTEWKSAIGQLLVYNHYLQKGELILLLINPPGRHYQREIEAMVEIGNSFNIRIWVYQRNGEVVSYA